jgi:hypothetical protein
MTVPKLIVEIQARKSKQEVVFRAQKALESQSTGAWGASPVNFDSRINLPGTRAGDHSLPSKGDLSSG